MKTRSQVLTIDQVKIGGKLKQWREYRLMTQQELADAADIGLRSIVRIENNHVEPRFSTIKKLSDALEVEPRQLISQQPPKLLDEQ